MTRDRVIFDEDIGEWRIQQILVEHRASKSIPHRSREIRSAATRGRVTSSREEFSRVTSGEIRASLSTSVRWPPSLPSRRQASVAWRRQSGSQPLSPGIKYSRWVGVARRFVGRGGRTREERVRTARSSVARRSMLGCAAAGEGRKEASEKKSLCSPLSLFPRSRSHSVFFFLALSVHPSVSLLLSLSLAFSQPLALALLYPPL